MKRVVLVLCCVLLTASCTRHAGDHTALPRPCSVVSNKAMTHVVGASVLARPVVLKKGNGLVTASCIWSDVTDPRERVRLATYRFDGSFAEAEQELGASSARSFAVHVPGTQGAVGLVYADRPHEQVVVGLDAGRLAVAFVRGTGETAGLRDGRKAVALLFAGSTTAPA